MGLLCGYFFDFFRKGGLGLRGRVFGLLRWFYREVGLGDIKKYS